jgi:hypothetical protein
MATTVKYNNLDLFELQEFGLDGDFKHRRLVQQQLFYVFNAFAVLMVIDVAVTTALLWRAWKKAGMPDKITNLMLYVLVPLYSIYGLLLMIFTIVFSPSGLPDTSAPTVFESADIASSVLITGTIIAIFFFILSMSGRKPYWNPGGVGLPPKQQQYWAPQAPYVYGSPVQVSQGTRHCANATSAVRSTTRAYSWLVDGSICSDAGTVAHIPLHARDHLFVRKKNRFGVYRIKLE